MLLSNLVSRTADPVNGSLAMVSVNIGVDFLSGWQVGGLFLVSGQFQNVELIRVSSSHANFTIDRSRCLAKQVILGGNKTCVTRQVFTRPASLLW